MNLLDLFVKISVDDQASDKVENLGAKVVAKGQLMADAAKLAMNGIVQVGQAVAGTVKQSVEAYAAYEQNVGGIQKLFGNMGKSLEEYAAMNNTTTDAVASQWAKLEDAQNTVLENANNAWKTAGMSANDYMQQVTSFSAALITSLGNDTQKAADYADMAMIDMSDNVNTFGSNMQDVQNAYQGFAKQNYTMLDNLKLGYGGTQSEMQRLIADASKLTDVQKELGVTVDGNSMSFSNIVAAIHVMQESMQIGGTTAREAATTIEGSINAMKSAWDNLLAGFGNEDADLGVLVTNFAESVATAAGNVLPRIGTILNSVGDLIIDYAPKLADKAKDMILSFADGLQDSGNMSKVVESAVEICTALLDAILSMIPAIIEAAPKIITAFAKALFDNRRLIADSGLNLMEALGEGIASMNKLIINVVSQNIVSPIVNEIKKLPEIARQWGVNLIKGLWNGILEKVTWIHEKFTGFVGGLVTRVEKLLGINSPSRVFAGIGKNIGLGVAVGLNTSKSTALKAADDLAKSVYQNNVEWLNRQVKYNDFSVKQQLSAWKAIQSQFISSSQQYADAEKQILDLRGKAEQEYYNNIEKVEKEYQDALSKRTSEIYNSYSLFDEIQEREQVSGDSLIENLRDQISTMEEFYNGLQTLKDKGVNDSLIEEIRTMGPEAVDQLDALLSLSDDKLSEYSELYGEKQKLANDEAKKELSTLRTDTLAQISENLSDLKSLYDDESPDVGEAFMDGLRQGIENGSSDVINAAIRTAQQSVDAVKTTLGIHSPSTVFAEIGENMVRGLGVGWESEYEDVQRGINDSLQFQTGNVDFASSGIGVSSAAMINSMNSASQNGGSFTFNLMLPDMTKLASYLFGPMTSYAKANGTPILNPQ